MIDNRSYDDYEKPKEPDECSKLIYTQQDMISFADFFFHNKNTYSCSGGSFKAWKVKSLK